MAQRSIPALPKTCNRKQPTKAALLKRTRAQRIPFRPGDRYSNKGRIHSRRPTCHSHFSLAKRRRTIHSGLSIREIANRLQRAVSTVSREVSRHGGRPLYRASEADRQAWESALRPKVCLLAIDEKLRTIVASKLILDWSPEQVSKWLKVDSRADGQSRGQIVDAISIRERPDVSRAVNTLCSLVYCRGAVCLNEELLPDRVRAAVEYNPCRWRGPHTIGQRKETINCAPPITTKQCGSSNAGDSEQFTCANRRCC
jgi:Helix-turn-helix domain